MRVLALLVLAAVGCTRDPIEQECPDLAVGDLVITEIRGPQTGADTLVSWIEVYNASGHDLALRGLKIRFRKKDGSGEIDVTVRRELDAAAGSYIVLGLVPDEDRPAYVDYGFSSDFHQSFLASAAVDIDACTPKIDRMTYDSLPKMGTYSLGGTPTADANDFPTAWCTDATMAGTTYPGTPQQANIACP